MLVDLIKNFSVEGANTTSTPKNELGKDEFLKLLVTQLKNQDPLEPLKNEQFIAQLAQFNALEEMINLNKSFASMLILQQMSQASSLIGKNIKATDSEGNLIEGKVSQVQIESGTPKLLVGNNVVALDSVVQIN